MLAQRVFTAIVLVAVLTGTLLAASPWPLSILLTVAAACALWEWLRLTGPRQASIMPAAAAAILTAFLFVLVWQQFSPVPAPWAVEVRSVLMRWLLPLVAAVWVFGVTVIVLRGDSQARPASLFLSIFGGAAVLVVWLSLLELYLVYGSWFLISLLALIWCADIAAYFTGKAFGRHKLAPAISPGKTWEGAAGGMAAGTLWLVASAQWPGSFGAVLGQKWPMWVLIVIGVLLSALSIVGDLFESLLKRRAGVKDSSRLLPGHGGVYDRIDALLPVVPVALLLTGASLS